MFSASTRVRLFTFTVTAAMLFEVGYAAPTARAADRGTPQADMGIESSADQPEGTAPHVDAFTEPDPKTGLKPGAIENVGARTEYSQSFDNADGTKTTLFYADPIFYKPEGSSTLQPISIDFLPSTAKGTVFVSAAAPATVAISDLSATKSFLSTTYQGNTISFALPAAEVPGLSALKPTVSGAVADYASLQPGLDLRIIAGAHGPKSFFVWRSAPIEATIRYAVDAPGLTLIAQDDGSIVLVDSAGTTAAAIPHPYAVDSTPNDAFGSGAYTDAVTLSLEADGKTVDVTVDPGWLETATYPVYVDPTLNWTDNAGSTNFGDTFVDSNWPTTNFANYQRPDSPYYHEMYNGVAPGYGTSNYDFLKWDLSLYANSTVDAASLRLYPYHQYYNAPTAETTYVRRVTANWYENTVNWNNKPAPDSTNMATTGCVEAHDCIFNVTAIVQSWLRASPLYTNYGFQVDTIGKGETYWKRFISSEESGSTHKPAFSMTYHTPTVTAAYPAGGGPSPSTTLSWAYVDSASLAQTQYHVDVATDAAFTQNLLTSGDVASSAKAWPVPSALTPGTTYYWRVKAYNGTSWSPLSATALFVCDLANLGLQAQFRTEDFDLGGGDQASVNVTTGDLILSHPIVSLPIRGSSLALGLTYNSQDPASVGMGPGWRLNVHRRLTLNTDSTVTFIDADGARYVFTTPVVNGSLTTYTRPTAFFANLVKDTSQGVEFTLTYRDQSRDTFDIAGAEGLLARSEDRHGNGVTLAYVSGSNRIDTITDTAGSRTVNVAYDGSNRVSSITDWAYLDGAGIVQVSATGTRRATRFFYDASGNLAGWADPLNTSGSCPTGGSHLTCLTYGATLAIAKTQTVAAISGGALTTTVRTGATAIKTEVSLVGAEVSAVRDAEQVFLSAPATTFTRDIAKMVVARPGTPASTTTYEFLAATDAYGRIRSVKRALAAAQIESETTYDATYPTEPFTLKENKGGGALERVTNYAYQASSLGLLSRLDEPLDGTYRRYTDYTYNANNDLTSKNVYSTDAATAHTETRYCYATSGCSTSASDLLLRSTIENYVDGTAGGANAHVEDVTTAYQYDAYGQRTRETRSNYSGSTLLDQAATGWAYDSYGNVTAEIRNYADGAVTDPGDDITPNSTTNARTDLTVASAYDTAGNRVSSADPRRAIKSALGVGLAADDYTTRTVFDALGQAVTVRLATALDLAGQADCSLSPACRESTTTFDELGLVRETADIADLVTATKYDRVGRALETYEDTTADAAAVTSISTYDAQGRLLTSKDREQSKAGSSLGYSQQAYDELGRLLAQAWAVGTTVDTETDYAYDNLDRRTLMATGVEDVATSQVTTWTYDIGGRPTEQNDEFTCTATTFDYRDRPLTVVEGKTVATPCTGVGTRTVTSTYDGLGRLTLSQVTAGTGLNDKLSESTFDSEGNSLTSSATRAGATTTTTYTLNPLDQAIAEVRSTGTWAKTNYDAAGGATDRCLWSASPSDPCMQAGSIFASPQPTSVTTSTYDGRNNRISLNDAVANTTTTYDPSHNYLIGAIYMPTGTAKEHQSLFSYDTRHRLTTVTHQLCTISSGHSCSSTVATGSDTYVYDDNSNKTGVTEANGAGTLVRGYCYDAVERVTATRDATGCTGTSIEAYTYDDSGNRKTTGSTTFTYDAQGQLTSCASPTCGTVSFDAAGRTQKWNGWAFEYDAQGRVTRACQSTTDCAGLYNEVESTYDAEGHRTQIRQYDSANAAAVATWDFRYQGAAIVEEKLTDAAHPSGAVIRSYVVNDEGSVVKLTIAPGETGAGTYLVTWNGHGDALGLWRIETDGSLTLANSFTYTTWGAPTTATHDGIADLGFRFLYVGEFDVQWDNVHNLGLHYMHARHYSPALGRFLQPDPDASEANLYAYAANNPVTEIDPSGTCFIICAIINAVVDTAIYLVTTDSSEWTVEGTVTAAATGAVTGFLGVGLLSKVGKIGAVARAASRATNILSRGAAVLTRSGRLGAAVVRQGTRVTQFVARDQGADWIRVRPTRVSNQLLRGPGARGSTMKWAISGGGPTKTGFNLPFHYHVGLYNLTRPWLWFRQTPILN